MRVAGWVAALLLAVAIAAAGAVLWYRQATLPEHEGTLRLRGLGAPVTIARDAQGVPHISAASEADALFALGYAHAQDRLWQLEFDRRIAQGRVSEIAGPDALESDRFMRTLGIYRAAQVIAGNLDAGSLALLEAYGAGINAYLQDDRSVLPPEFLLTRTPRPAPWRPADTVAWTLMMAWDLASASYYNELARLRLAARFSKAEIDEIRPPYPGEAPLKTRDYVELYRSLGVAGPGGSPPQTLMQQAARLARLHPLDPFGSGEGIGSNNWIVSGAHTKSGKPLLANDPHLGLSTPSVWYFARLHAPGLDVFGATLPGVPYVILGRTPKVAWGFTNTGTDALDLYLERVDPDDLQRYQTPDGFARFDTRIETIGVRGEPPVVMTVRATRHGPVMSDAVPALQQALPRGGGARYVLAVRWTAFEPTDGTLGAIRAMNHATDAAQFEQALRDFTVVMQNVGFADSDGHIGFVAAGRLPLRRADNDMMGLAPAPGWDARYDWQGWLPFEQLPRVIDPPDGIIVTANQRITPAGYPHFVTSEWNLPYRSDRIRALLRDFPRHDVASFARIQADVTSLAARDFLQALRGTQPATEGGKAALARLLAWDGTMRADEPEPLIFHAWLRKLRARLFDDDFGPLADSFVAHTEMTHFTLDVLTGRTSARDWCDDLSTPDRHETCAEQAAGALDDTVAELTRDGGRELSALKWGKAHRAVFEHRPLSFVPVLRDWFELGITDPGDTFSVDVGSLRLRGDHPFETRHAPSLRAIYDLSDGGGQWIFGPGQVGNPFSEHYGDLLTDWRNVRYRKVDWNMPRGPELVLKPTGR